MTADPQARAAGRTCTMPGCNGAHEARGYCKKHYERWRVHRDPNVVLPKVVPSQKRDPIDKVFRRTEWQGDCLIFTGTVNASGYGVVREGDHFIQKQLQAHRVVYAETVGEIPEGMYVLHSCDVRRCCNPDHLRVGTHEDNMRDMRERRRGWWQIGDAS